MYVVSVNDKLLKAFPELTHAGSISMAKRDEFVVICQSTF